MENSGLEGVVVAETAISHIDGERGTLIIAGQRVGELARKSSVEQAAGAIWSGDAASLRARLAESRAAAFEALPTIGDALSAADGMDALRAAVAHLRVDSPAAISGAVAVFAAAWSRARGGEDPIPPDASLGHAADYLQMMGLGTDVQRARALEMYLVTVMDHGMNASTFAARVVTSTRSDAVSAVVAAIGALKGPLHGGAPGPVLDMLDAVQASGDPRAWVDAELAAGRRIMGMGHRVYRVRDPRAAVLEDAALRLGAGAGRVELARAVEGAAGQALADKYPLRSLRANVEFYTAVLLEAIGLERTQFSPTFAVGRVFGWCAHIMEQRQHGRLIRPSSRYVGAWPS